MKSSIHTTLRLAPLPFRTPPPQRLPLFNPPARSLFTTPTVASTPLSVRLINLTKITALIATLVGSYAYLTDTRAGVHAWLGVPLIKALTEDDPERAHRLAIRILKFLGETSLVNDRPQPGDEKLAFELWGRRFDNPIGLGAGFDKDGDAVDGLFDMGFGYVEIGSVTPEPQPGNAQPRMFRIPSTSAIVNRYGFNSEGHFAVLAKLRKRILAFLDHHRYLGHSSILSRHDNLNPVQTAYADAGFTQLVLPQVSELLSLDHELVQAVEQTGLPRSLRNGRVLAVNLGKNKTSAPESVEDFKAGIARFGPLADVLVINVSSPNTPGLRALQTKDVLAELLREVVECRDELKPSLGSAPPPAVLVKIAPDLSVQELVDVGMVSRDAGIDGIIVSNTTTSRPEGAGTEPEVHEAGGLSGPPLKPLSLRALSTVYAATEGAVPLIGCGGIRSGADVLEYGKAGASFVELYTALTYEGLGTARRIKEELKGLLDGREWGEIVGSGAERGVSVEELIRRAPPPPPASFQDRLREVKEQIAHVQERVNVFTNSSQPSTAPKQVDEHPVPSATQISPHNDGAPVSGFTSPSTQIKIEESKKSLPQVVTLDNGETAARGILTDWKRKRDREIESGNLKRVV